MSETVTLHTEVEVNIYKVTCYETGYDFSFDVEADCDGDLVITVHPDDYVPSFNADTMRDHLEDKENLDELIHVSCESGLIEALGLITEEIGTRDLKDAHTEALKAIQLKLEQMLGFAD